LKHKKAISLTKNLTSLTEKVAVLGKNNYYKCDICDKQYNSRVGLWYHHKKCASQNTTIVEEENKIYENVIKNMHQLVLDVVKSNNEVQKQSMELQKQLIEVCKNIQPSTNNTINTIHNNSHNKTFNLNLFLNETCKDAMNISDFVESIKLQISDLENVGKVGYIEGISNIIIKNLQALDVEKRPVHCTDQKREVMYVKDENIWEKEDESNNKLRKAIRMIAHKNICMLKEFRVKYPDCEEYNSNKNSQYNKIVIEAMGGKGDDDFEKNSKIIKKIAKVVGIEKN
jgi:hypothetical protein